MSLKIKIQYDLKENTYRITSEIKKERIQEVIEELLRAQIGAGSDKGEPVEKDIYTIFIDLELEGDIFNVSADTGNKSLTTGILAQLIGKLDKNSENVEIVPWIEPYS
jgi:hypothetical protein